jgi:hypothetical protein
MDTYYFITFIEFTPQRRFLKTWGQFYKRFTVASYGRSEISLLVILQITLRMLNT